VRGLGEGSEHVSLTQMKDLTFSEATRISGEKAFRMAGVGPGDFQHVMLYDAFTSGRRSCWSRSGGSPAGEGVRFFEEGRSTPGGSLPINTNGAASPTRTRECTAIFRSSRQRQLRGAGGPRQVPALQDVAGSTAWRMLSAAGTLVLATNVAALAAAAASSRSRSSRRRRGRRARPRPAESLRLV